MIHQFKIAEANITKVETLLAKKLELDSFQKKPVKQLLSDKRDSKYLWIIEFTLLETCSLHIEYTDKSFQ